MATSNIAHLMASYPHTYLAISLRPLAQPSERRAIRNGHRLREGKRVGENQCHGLRANQISFAKSWRGRPGAEPPPSALNGAQKSKTIKNDAELSSTLITRKTPEDVNP